MICNSYPISPSPLQIQVRHECAEALGAIGAISCIPILQKVAHEDASIEVGQTCHLALEFIQWKERKKKKKGSVETKCTLRRANQQEVENDEIEEEEEDIVVCACMLKPYSSADPAPPHPKHVALSTPEIGAILQDVNAPLFERFRAMFSLRNRGGEDCVKELGNALGESKFPRLVSVIICYTLLLFLYSCSQKFTHLSPFLLRLIKFLTVTDESSALLRHEVAYVLGQMQHPHAVEYLACSLERTNEHRMVRHESAEALGAIEERWGECEGILRKYLTDKDDVVRESCVVALDAADYWGYSNQVVGEHDGDDRNEIKPDDAKELESVNLMFKDEKEEGQRRVNFSIQKAQTDGKTNLRPEGVLQNHFNIAAL